MRGRRRAFALLFALGILVLLSVFALSFANLTRLERLAAANVRVQVQATHLADAGVAMAAGAARDAARRRPWTNPTEDWWATGVTFPDPAQAPGQTLARNDSGGLDQLQIVSFDAASKLDVNLDTPNISRALELAGLTAAQVTDLLADRAAAGGAFRSREELCVALTPEVWYGDPASTTPGLRDSLTVHSTPRLVASGTLTGNLPYTYPSGPTSRVSLSFVNINAARRHILLAVLSNLEGRSVETASDPVAGDWLDTKFEAGRARVTTGASFGVNETIGGKVADEIIACREKRVGNHSSTSYNAQPFAGPFKTWWQFDLFLANLVTTNVITAQERALILAVAHVDARHMGYNPDGTRLGGGLVDRFMVTRFTSALSLCAAGILEVRSHGWSTSPDDADPTTTAVEPYVLADAECDRVVRVFTPVHYGTQQELEAMWVSPDRSIYQSMPELMPRTQAGISNPADPVDGHVRLTTEWNSLPPTCVGNLSTLFRSASNPGSGYSFNRPLNTPAAAALLRDEGIFGPDGALVWRKDWETGPAQLINSNDIPESFAKEGSFELWVKLRTDQTQGTDECLVAFVVDDTASWTGGLRSDVATCLGGPEISGEMDVEGGGTGYVFPSNMGATVKLERFRHVVGGVSTTRLRATWYYWGSGNGSVSRFALALAEVHQDITSWQPGEWHHVAVSWRNTEQNWPNATAGNPMTVGSVPSDGVTLRVDDVSAVAETFEAPALESRGYQGVLYHMGKTISVPAAEGIRVGGYTITLASANTVVMNTGRTVVGPLHRFVNGTLDDLFVYSSPGGAPGRARTTRYEENPGPNRVGADFDLPVGTYHEVGCVGAELEVPPTCEALLTVPSVNSQLAPDPLVIRHENIYPPSGAPLVSNGKLRARVVLSGTGLATPVLEHFTVLLLPPVQVIEDTRDPRP